MDASEEYVECYTQETRAGRLGGEGAARSVDVQGGAIARAASGRSALESSGNGPGVREGRDV